MSARGSCPDRELLSALHDGELPAAEASRVEGHARDCADCQAVLERHAETSRLLAGLPQPRPTASQLAALAEEVRTAGPAPKRGRWPTWALAASALIAGLIVTRLVMLQVEQAPTFGARAPMSEVEVAATAAPVPQESPEPVIAGGGDDIAGYSEDDAGVAPPEPESVPARPDVSAMGSLLDEERTSRATPADRVVEKPVVGAASPPPETRARPAQLRTEPARTDRPSAGLERADEPPAPRARVASGPAASKAQAPPTVVREAPTRSQPIAEALESEADLDVAFDRTVPTPALDESEPLAGRPAVALPDPAPGERRLEFAADPQFDARDVSTTCLPEAGGLVEPPLTGVDVPVSLLALSPLQPTTDRPSRDEPAVVDAVLEIDADGRVTAFTADAPKAVADVIESKLRAVRHRPVTCFGAPIPVRLHVRYTKVRGHWVGTLRPGRPER